MNESEAYEFYSNPANRAPQGPAVRRQRKATLGGTIPVRFPEEMVTAVKRFAEHDGVTVSTWIRNLVARELERRQTPQSRASYSPEFVFTVDSGVFAQWNQTIPRDDVSFSESFVPQSA